MALELTADRGATETLGIKGTVDCWSSGAFSRLGTSPLALKDIGWSSWAFVCESDRCHYSS